MEAVGRTKFLASDDIWRKSRLEKCQLPIPSGGTPKHFTDTLFHFSSVSPHPNKIYYKIAIWRNFSCNFCRWRQAKWRRFHPWRIQHSSFELLSLQCLWQRHQTGFQVGRRLFGTHCSSRSPWHWNHTILFLEHGKGTRKQYQFCDTLFFVQPSSNDRVLYFHLYDDGLGQVQTLAWPFGCRFSRFSYNRYVEHFQFKIHQTSCINLENLSFQLPWGWSCTAEFPSLASTWQLRSWCLALE